MSLSTSKIFRNFLSLSTQPLLQSRQPLLLSGCQMSGMDTNYQTLNVTDPSTFVVHVELNRPTKMNALSKVMCSEIEDVFTKLDLDPDCRVVVLSGAGKMFSAGVDLSDLAQLTGTVYSEEDIAKKSLSVYQALRQAQRFVTSLEKCRKPVICCIHNGCVGAGVDLITAADIRLCTEDAWFCVKEVDMGIAADVGTLQRLPKVIGSQSLVNELCFTARKMRGGEAQSCGLVSCSYHSKEDMMQAAGDMAAGMAAKSPVAVQGTKVNLVYSREHSVAEGLDHVAKWNMTMLQSEDVIKSAMAAMSKTKHEDLEFSKL